MAVSVAPPPVETPSSGVIDDARARQRRRRRRVAAVVVVALLAGAGAVAGGGSRGRGGRVPSYLMRFTAARRLFQVHVAFGAGVTASRRSQALLVLRRMSFTDQASPPPARGS